MAAEPAGLRVALVGCGGISRAHAAAYRRLGPEVARVTATADAVLSLAEERAAQLGAGFATGEYRRVLERGDVDAVDICLPHHLHAEVAVAAARAGKHVLVEKPMACTLEECRAMVAAAEDAGVTLMVAQVQRYLPSYRGVKRLCASGELGAIRAVRFDSMQNAPGFLPRDHWLFDGRLAGGGIVISVSVHRIDLVRYLVGDVRRVLALTRPGAAPYRNGAEDYAAAVLEFENGAIGEHFATYSGFRMPYSEMFMIFGDDGAVHALPPPGQAAGPAFFASRRREDRAGRGEGWAAQFGGFLPVPPDGEGLPAGEDGFANEIAHFAACCRSGAEPESSGRDNLGTMGVILGIYRSAETGRWVDLASL
jgi:predicted dehydrogenase